MSAEPQVQQVEYCRELLSSGIGGITTLKALRAKFGLDLVEAKDVFIRASTGVSLDQHQENLAKALEEAAEHHD